MTLSAWIMLAVTWTIIALLTGRFLLRVLTKRAGADRGGADPR